MRLRIRLRAVDVDRLALNVFFGEGGDRLVTHLPAPTEARSVSQT